MFDCAFNVEYDVARHELGLNTPIDHRQIVLQGNDPPDGTATLPVRESFGWPGSAPRAPCVRGTKYNKFCHFNFTVLRLVTASYAQIGPDQSMNHTLNVPNHAKGEHYHALPPAVRALFCPRPRPPENSRLTAGIGVIRKPSIFAGEHRTARAGNLGHR